MAENPPDRDPLFDNVEEWQAELDRQRAVDRLAAIIVTVFVVVLTAVILMIVFNSGTDGSR